MTLDRQVSGHGMTDTSSRSIQSSYQLYLEKKESLETLQGRLSELTTELQLANQVLALMLLTAPDPQTNLPIQNVMKLINENKKEISAIVS